MSPFWEKVLPFFKQHIYAILLAMLGVGFLGYGLFAMGDANEKRDEITFEAKNIRPSSTVSKAETKRLLIDVSGAVNKPGVYELESSSRMQDAIAAAGGFAPHADTHQIAQKLNLAAPLTDGAKIYIPSTGDQMAGAGQLSGTSVIGTETGSININTADEAALDSLSGVGKVTAGKIIANRPYGSIEELLEKKIVGQAVFEKIKEQISVY